MARWTWPSVKFGNALGDGSGGGGLTVISYNERTGVVVSQDGDYAASQVTNDSAVPGLRVSNALNALLASVGTIPTNLNQLAGTISDAQHGTRAGGTLHPDVVAAGASGFMSGTDKTKLDQLGFAVLGSDQTNNTTTPATALMVSGLAAATYRFTMFGAFQSASTAVGIQLAVNANASSLLVYSIQQAATSSTFSTLNGSITENYTTATNISVANSNFPHIIQGLITFTAGSSSLQTRFRSSTGGTAVTVKAGAVIQYQRLN